MTKEPITVRIEPDIWKEVRKKALDYKISAGALVETAILRFLRSYSKKEIEECRNVIRRDKMAQVKTTCPQCEGLGYCELENFETKKPVKCKCDTCEGKKYVMTEKIEE